MKPCSTTRQTQMQVCFQNGRRNNLQNLAPRVMQDLKFGEQRKSMTSKIKAVIFDFGGVLINWDPRNLYSRFFPEQPQAMEDFLAEISFMEWNAQQDKGRPFAEAVALLSKQFPHRAHLISAYQGKLERIHHREH